MFKRSLSAKLFAILFLVLCPVIIGFQIFVYQAAKTAIQEEAVSSLDHLMKTKIETLEDNLKGEDLELPDVVLADVIFDKVESFNNETGFTAVIKPPDEILIVSSNLSIDVFDESAFFRRLKEGRVGTLTDTIEGVDYLARFRPMLDNRWVMVSGDQQQVLYRNIEKITTLTISQLVMTLIVLLGVGFFVSTTITRPIISMAETFNQSEDPHEIPYVEVKRIDEIGVLAGGFNTLISNIKDYTQQLQKAFEREKEAQAIAMETQMAAARIVQHSFLPKSLSDERIEVANYYLPAEHTGGDIYQYFIDSSKKYMTSVLIDVTGHGIPSAMLAGAIAGAIRSEFRRCDRLGLGGEDIVLSVTQNLNLLVCEFGGGLAATGVAVSLNLESGQVHMCNAAHPAPILWNKQKPKLWIRPGPVLGMSTSATFTSSSKQFEQGDAMLVFTDGLIENHGSAEEPIPNALLKREMTHFHGKTELVSHLSTVLKGRMHGEIPEDDTSILMVRWTGSHQSREKRKPDVDPSCGVNSTENKAHRAA